MKTYLIYLKQGRTPTIDLSSTTESYDVKWFDPRNGGNLLGGSITTVTGGGATSLGSPPNNNSGDWAVLLNVISTGPRMQLSSSQVTYRMKPGDLSTISDNNTSISITNAGINLLQNVTASSSASWLDVNFTDNDGNEQEILLSANQEAELLGNGSHFAIVEIQASNAKMVRINVKVNISDACFLNEQFDDQ